MIGTLTLTTLLLTAPIGQDATAAKAVAPAAAAIPAAIPSAHSGLAVVPARIDLGTVERGTTVRSSTWLVNTSLEPVTVKKADAGCGCTTVHFTPVTIAPGAAERVWFDIKAPGKVTAKSVKLNFHPEWGERVTLTTAMATSDEASAGTSAAANRPTDVMLVPVASDLGTIVSGTTVETSAWLINTGESIARVNEFKAGCGCTTAVGFAPTDLAPGTAKRVRLRIKPNAKKKAVPVKTVTLKAIVDGVEAPVLATLTMAVQEQVADRGSK